jgi:nucleoid-associated protein YgaU
VVFKGSRYANAEVITPPGADGVRRRVLAVRRAPETVGVVEHVVTGEERLDHLAQQFYRDPTKYWLILDANREVVNPFELLRPGRRIRIPANRFST